MVMTDETVVDVLEVAEKVLVEVSERVKVSTRSMVRRSLLIDRPSWSNGIISVFTSRGYPTKTKTLPPIIAWEQ